MRIERFLARAGAAALTTLLSFGAAHADVPSATITEWQIPFLWRAFTSSPEPAAVGENDPLYPTCGRADGALQAVAARNGSRKLAGEPALGSDELSFALRAAGSPYIWPRTWTMRGRDLDPAKVEEALAQFMAKSTPLGERRCGIARFSTPQGIQIVSVVVADVIADVESVPTVARVGDWITLKGTLLVPATDAKVVLLGPRGKPKTVLASLTDSALRSTFSVDQPGDWLVQVLANVATGPRPVLELRIHAGGSPAVRYAETPAPGEQAASSDSDEASALRAMLNAARTSEGLAALTPDSALDKAAREHSRRMKDARVVGHDVGDGDVADRLSAASIQFKIPGENVAAAATLVRAHRALWLSPSHRTNILESRFKRVGVGIEHGDDGRVWVTQLFTD